jgi:acyl carrier protein
VKRAKILALLEQRLAVVLALDPTEIDEASRFDEDLHADSLDLVEVIEAVERELAERGSPVSVSDDELLGLETVGQAADLLQGLAEPQ